MNQSATKPLNMTTLLRDYTAAVQADAAAVAVDRRHVPFIAARLVASILDPTRGMDLDALPQESKDILIELADALFNTGHLGPYITAAGVGLPWDASS